MVHNGHFEEKSVPRTEVASSVTSDGESADADYIAKLASTFGQFSEASGLGVTVNPPTNNIDDDEEHEFRLFANDITADDSVDAKRKIALRSPSPTSQACGHIRIGRPDDYYFTGEPSEELVRQFRQAAVSGADIRACVRTRWEGCQLPWRVTVIRQARTREDVGAEQVSSSEIVEPTRRSKVRKGKKKRIAIRKKLAADRSQMAARAQEKELQDAAEKEKRNKRNRDKKQKKRQRIREAKASESGPG